MQHVVQWSKSAGEQGVLCTVITRMLLDHIRIIVHMDISFIILLYTTGRRRKKLLDDLGDRRGYSHLKEEALDRIKWMNRFRRGCGPVV
jgi:hypothetical protein